MGNKVKAHKNWSFYFFLCFSFVLNCRHVLSKKDWDGIAYTMVPKGHFFKVFFFCFFFFSFLYIMAYGALVVYIMMISKAYIRISLMFSLSFILFFITYRVHMRTDAPTHRYRWVSKGGGLGVGGSGYGCDDSYTCLDTRKAGTFFSVFFVFHVVERMSYWYWGWVLGCDRYLQSWSCSVCPGGPLSSSAVGGSIPFGHE
ncbi:hypothetical protein DFH27DRAFT_135672 [Peziza echinospora]|nr:hypothetical protein DFH27DRAFT_135672 [Peziza echinospora]